MTWLNGDIANYPLSGVMHEMGHNMNLQHAAFNGDEYADHSCIMGIIGSQRCFGAPNAWASGWARTIPGGDLAGSMPTGESLVSPTRFPAYLVPAWWSPGCGLHVGRGPGPAAVKPA